MTRPLMANGGSWLRAMILGAYSLFGCSQQNYDSLYNPSVFAELDARLQEEVANSHPGDLKVQLTNSATFKRMRENAALTQLLNMARNEKHPLLSVGAFYAVQEKYPTKASMAACLVLIHSEAVTKGLTGDVEEFLSGHSDKKELHSCLDQITPNSVECSKTNLLVIADIFETNGVLKDWFENYSNEIPQPWLSIILGELIPMDGTNVLSRKERISLAACSRESGFPLYVYLLLTSGEDDEYLSILERCFEDMGISDAEFTFLVARKKELLPEIQLEELNLTEERRRLIKKELARVP